MKSIEEFKFNEDEDQLRIQLLDCHSCVIEFEKRR
jgi:hypothetical protein